ncbi:unnamed protein product [Brassica oleracea]
MSRNRPSTRIHTFSLKDLFTRLVVLIHRATPFRISDAHVSIRFTGDNSAVWRWLPTFNSRMPMSPFHLTMVRRSQN